MNEHDVRKILIDISAGRNPNRSQRMLSGLVSILFGLLAFALIYFIAGLLSVYYGWVLSVLWGWFIVPLGVKALSVPHAIGVMFVVGMFTMGITRVSFEGEGKNKAIVGALVGPLSVLLFGYVVHLFM